jgi:hypothetical protein
MPLIGGIIRRGKLLLRMRRLYLTLLVCLVAVPAAYAAVRTPGDGVLELRNVAATVVVNGARGTLWGQMDKGKLVVTDPLPGDGQIYVSGWEQRRPGATDQTWVYSGVDLHFRVTGGKYRLVFKGVGIDFTAVGVGSAQLTGDFLADDPGSYAVDGGKWVPVPYALRVVQFGTQPTTVGGPPATP